jgi:hypothetical protein
LKRREFCTAALALGLVSARPATAHPAAEFELPLEFEPTLIDVGFEFQAGEIHVFPNLFNLFWMIGDGLAVRYTVGVGRPGLYHDGRFTVGDKREWPKWRPTDAMIARDPDAYAKYAEGMPGGIDNPLGARALYLFDEAGHDTYLRIHGTNDPRTIGTAVSNGCARLTNDHIVDLYDQVPTGTSVNLYRQNGV